MRYAELHCKTNYSFLSGASHPDELVARAVELGYAALAITDEQSLAGVVRAFGAARQTNLKLIIGAEIATKKKSHWFAALCEAGVPCAPVNTIAEAVADPQVERPAVVVKVPSEIRKYKLRIGCWTASYGILCDFVIHTKQKTYIH